jgi:hypothetical protein
MITSMSRGAAVLLAAVIVACEGSNPGSPGIGPPTGGSTPLPAATPTPTPTPIPSPTPTPIAAPSPDASPDAPPPCGDLFMRLIRPDNGAQVTNDPQVVEASVGHSIVRVEFYYHIDAIGAADPSAMAAQSPPVLINTRNGPPWRVNWKLPPGCGNTVSLLAIGYDACGGGNDTGLVRVTTCK